jgi:hypothetical protein
MAVFSYRRHFMGLIGLAMKKFGKNMIDEFCNEE